MFVLLFTLLAPQGIVCYTFWVHCRAVISLPCVKGGGSRKRVGGIVKNKILSKNNPSAAFGVSSLYTREPLVCAPESLSAFPDKHCFCGHKSEAPREAGRKLLAFVF